MMPVPIPTRFDSCGRRRRIALDRSADLARALVRRRWLVPFRPLQQLAARPAKGLPLTAPRDSTPSQLCAYATLQSRQTPVKTTREAPAHNGPDLTRARSFTILDS